MKRSLLCLLFALLALGSTLLSSACGPLTAPQIVAVTPLPTGGQDRAAPRAPTASPVQAPTADPIATPTPLALDLPPGSAAAIALATDVAMHPTIENPQHFAESPVPLTFEEFYNGFNLRTGLVLSDKLVALDGQEVVIEGYMAPPLKPELDWFVLTRIRLEFCPFCSSTADWPDDIALVYLLDQPVRATIQPLRIQGRLEIGSAVDPETGMVSVVRIYAGQMELLASQDAPTLALARTDTP